jgi:hypothetical protein
MNTPSIRRLQRCAFALAPTFSLLGPPAAIASNTRVAVAPVVLEGDARDSRVDPAEARRKLADRIDHVLRSGPSGFAVARCVENEQPCSLAQARREGADYLVHATLITEAADQRVRFMIREVKTGEAVAAFEDVCELCGRTELDTFMDAIVGALAVRLGALEPHAASVTIVGMPDRAGVWLDERRVGTLPWRGEVPPGEHVVKVERRGYLPEHRTIEVVPGTRERVRVDLDRDPTATARALKISGWALVGAGAASVGGGAVLWALDGRSHRASCSQPDAHGRCPNEYSSRAGGIALTVMGLSAVAVGGTILIYERVRFQRTRWRAGLQPGWRRASLKIRF